MIDFGQTLGGIALGTLIPVYIALIIFSKIDAKPSRVKYFAALGLGILLFFLVDIIIDSTELGANSGFAGGAPQAGLLISFAAGALILAFIERKSLRVRMTGESLFLVPALIALALGVHGAGEGSSFAFVASTTSSGSLLTAFGGLYPLVSYVIHKFLEAVIVGSAYFIYVISGPNQRRQRIWEILTLGLLMGLPSILGTAVGYYVAVHPIYFYAFAAGASIYVITKLAPPSFQQGWDSATYSPSSTQMVTMIMLLVGFLLLYFAALFHSTL